MTTAELIRGSASQLLILAVAIGGAVIARRAAVAAVASVAQLAVGAIVCLCLKTE